jgi:hypothetical protein
MNAKNSIGCECKICAKGYKQAQGIYYISGIRKYNEIGEKRQDLSLSPGSVKTR